MTPVWKNDLEGAVIGAIFLRGADPEVLDILSEVPATAFSVPQYREIYTGICRQARGAGVIDPVLLCENMPKHSAIIMDSSRIAWAKSALVSYVSTLERNAAVRDAEAVIERALADLRNAHNSDAALSAFRAAQNSIAAITLEEKTVQPVHIDDILPAVVDRVDARNRGLEEARSLMTGIEELDAKTGGIEPTDLVFIAARPSMGKTELALDIIDKVSEQGRGVLFFSMEMPNIQIGERMVSAAGGMSVSRLKRLLILMMRTGPG